MANTLFENINFRINSRERVGLVGRNGHGKTTLFKMIVKKEHPDTGAIVIPKNYRIGYVEQELNFKKETIIGECMTGFSHHEKDQQWKAEKILSGLGFARERTWREVHGNFPADTRYA